MGCNFKRQFITSNVKEKFAVLMKDVMSKTTPISPKHLYIKKYILFLRF